MNSPRIYLIVLATLFILVLLSTHLLFDYSDREVPQRFQALNSTVSEERVKRIVSAMEDSWKTYHRDCFGSDECYPISHKASNFTSASVGFMTVDALDTLMLMRLDHFVEQAREWVENELDFAICNGYISTFELNIRVLGGLLSAYALSKDDIYRQRATDLGERILGVLSTKHGLPLAQIDLSARSGKYNDVLSTAEVGTMQMELKYLAFISNDERFWRAAEKIGQQLADIEPNDGLAPVFISYLFILIFQCRIWKLPSVTSQYWWVRR